MEHPFESLQIPVLRSTDDLVVDEHGASQSVTLSDLERVVAEAPVSRAKKLNIPIPVGADVDDYETRVPGGYRPPVSYIKLVKKSAAGDDDVLDYVLDKSDEVRRGLGSSSVCADVAESEPCAVRHVLGLGHARHVSLILTRMCVFSVDCGFGVGQMWLQKRGQGLLDGDRLERMVDVLEKATQLGDPISQDEAEGVLTARLGLPATSAAREVVADVYQYWLAKRRRFGKPVLRRFWPVTAPDDTNPHNVFRPREKERYKLRKHRKNDMESFRKMQQLRRELGRVRVLLDLVRHRERLKQLAVGLDGEAFDQQLRDIAKAPPQPPAIDVIL